MLDYFALGLLFFVAIVLFYGVIVIHDIPYEIAKARNHPQQDALHVAGWVSLFTLHTIWPFLWIWATLYREDRGWGFSVEQKEEVKKIVELQNQIILMQDKLNTLLTTHEKLQEHALLLNTVENKLLNLELELSRLKQTGKEP